MCINKRKKEHIDVCLNKDVESSKSNGFEKFKLKYRALPEINLKDIDLSTNFMNKKLSIPIYISPISGGVNAGKIINENLAKISNKYNIPMCVGSMRAAIEDESLLETFNVRNIVKDSLLFSNLGAVQLNYGYGLDECKKVVEMINADGLVFHLNPLQEAIQPNGDTNFSELLEKIKKVIDNVNYPIIVKEVGHGVSCDVAKSLENIGLKYIDVAGLGGTSWALVEGFRRGNNLGETFRDVGISTCESLIEIKKNTGLKIIASGGIRNGIDVVKALCLGASLVGIALPLLKNSMESYSELENYFENLIKEIKIAMFCVGANNISELNEDKIKKTVI